MSVRDYEAAVATMARATGLQSFEGPRDEGLVLAAERALGLRLPPTYRRFVREYGAGNFGSFEIYGVISQNFETSSVPDAIWYTLGERRDGRLPQDLVVIGEDGAGTLYCVRCGGPEDEGAVIALPSARPLDKQAQTAVAADFGAFFLDGVSRQAGRRR